MVRRNPVSGMLLAVALTTGTLVFAAADEKRPMTVEGTVECARCVLKENDAKVCQDVLTVRNGPLTAKYYVVDKTSEAKAARGCKGKVSVRVTGKVEVDKNKKMTVYATAIELATPRENGPKERTPGS